VEQKTDGFHFIFSGGLARAFLADVGVIIACRRAGIKIATMGGVSAGSIAALMATSGMTDLELIKAVMDEDFTDLLKPNYRFGNWLRLGWAILNRRRLMKTLPIKGIYGTEAIGTLVERYVSHWPRGFWTMAYLPGAQIIFTESGVLKRHCDGRTEVLQDKPAPVSAAIRATCGLPGFFDALRFTTNGGSTNMLFDGILSWDGMCPTGLVEHHFGASRESIIPCDVGKYDKPNRMLHEGYGAVITPDPPFAAYKLKLSRDEKWLGIVAGYDSAAIALQKSNLISGLPPLVCPVFDQISSRHGRSYRVRKAS
jgi:predicted acylesterase/phospholipase RssA